MKPNKKFLIVLTSLIVLYFIISVFLPKSVTVSVSREFNGDQSSVFGLVNDLRKWDYWNQWHQLDKEWQTSYSTPSEGISANVQWKSNSREPGKGKAIIVNTFGYDSILVEMEIEGKGKGTSLFSFIQKNEKLTVSWKLQMETGFVGRLWPGLTLKSKYEEWMKESLRKIDSLSATDIALPPAGIAGIYKYEKENVVMLKDSCAENDVAFAISSLYSKIQAHAGEARIKGAPLCIYHGAQNGKVVFEAAIAFDRKTETSTNISIQKALVYNYYGSLSEIKNAYNSIAAYLQEKGFNQTGNAIEEYVSDNQKQRDPAKWLTKIYIPVE